ncbi:MAG: hypothetical protein R3E32_23165 [Chitinophagales bacterium]
MSKYHLTELINSLNKEELRNFKIYATRTHQSEEGKKIIDLFEGIQNDQMDEFGDDLIAELYPNGNKNAYYRLKNRLVEDIEHSLLMLNRKKYERFKIFNWLQLARIFSYKSDYEKAFFYLKKAEKLAIKEVTFDLLNIIYDEIIGLCGVYYTIDPQKYLERKQKNRVKQDATQKAEILMATIGYKLRKTNFAHNDNAVIDKLNQIIAELSVAEEYLDDHNIQRQIHICVKNVLLQKRDFVALEQYLIQSLHDFEEKKLFVNAAQKILMLSWIVNVSTKNKKFEQSLQYAEQLHKLIMDDNRAYYDKYIWLYHQSLIINYSFLGRNREVIDLLEEVEHNPKLKGNIFYDVFVYLNLAASYYCEKQVDKALGNLAMVLATDLYKTLADNLQLNVSILELILRIETHDFEYVAHRLRDIKRRFSKELKQTAYQREKQFLQILQDVAFKAEPFRSKKVQTKIQEFLTLYKDIELGSNETINYVLWLQSKLQKRDYYDLVLESVR